MPRGAAGGAEAHLPAGGPHPEAVPAPQHRAAHRHRRAETAYHDRYGTCARYLLLY